LYNFRFDADQPPDFGSAKGACPSGVERVPPRRFWQSAPLIESDARTHRTLKHCVRNYSSACPCLCAGSKNLSLCVPEKAVLRLLTPDL
jgi:hypothetical protein